MPVSNWSSETRFLFRVALVVFTVTVAIGILNGFHFIELSRAVLLTHVHAGTLGFITLSAIGAAFWLYTGPGGPWTATPGRGGSGGLTSPAWRPGWA